MRLDIGAAEKPQAAKCLLHSDEAVFYVRTHTEGQVHRTGSVIPALGDGLQLSSKTRALSLEEDEGGGPGVEWEGEPDGYWRQVGPPASSGALGSSGLSQKPQLPAWKVTLELVTWM